MVKQKELEGMKPKKIAALERLALEWREKVAAHREATEAVVDAKDAVRQYMAKHDIEQYFLDGHGLIKRTDPQEWDVVFKKITRKEKSTDGSESA